MIKLFSTTVFCLAFFQLSAAELQIATGKISKAMFSPDGKQVSWVVKDGRNYSLFVRKANGGDQARKLFTPLYKRTFYSWSPDGKTIACTGKKGRKRLLTLIEVDSGTSQTLYEGFNPVFMPSGKKILFFTLKNLCVFDLKSKKVETLSDFSQRQSFERIAVHEDNIYFSNNGDLWHATLSKPAKMLFDHKSKGMTQPFIQNPVVTKDGKSIYVSLITDGLYAHATDNILGRYELNAGKITHLTEANSWSLAPTGNSVVYCLGGDLKRYPGGQNICRGAEPRFSPDGKKLLFIVSKGWDGPKRLMIRLMTLTKSMNLNEISYPCSIDDSNQKAMWYAPEKQSTPIPLLVGLHTWSGNYKQSSGKTYFKLAKQRGWAMIFPNFRGPNRTPDAMCSAKAVQDIVDAVTYAKKHANIDSNRIYLCGASGGGLMAMMMAGRHSEIWAGVSAWCGISDINAWHTYNKMKRRGYGKQIELALGGDPSANPALAAEAKRRSPVTYLSNAKKVSLDIYGGSKDTSVPPIHSEKGFEAVVGKDIPWDLKHSNKVGGFKILKRKTLQNTRLTIFDGGHTIVYNAAIDWLSHQRKGGGVIWKGGGNATGGSEIQK